MKLFEIILSSFILLCHIAVMTIFFILGDCYDGIMFALGSIVAAANVLICSTEKKTTSYSDSEKMENKFWLFWSVVGVIGGIIILTDSITQQNVHDICYAVGCLAFSVLCTHILIKTL